MVDLKSRPLVLRLYKTLSPKVWGLWVSILIIVILTGPVFYQQIQQDRKSRVFTVTALHSRTPKGHEVVWIQKLLGAFQD